MEWARIRQENEYLRSEDFNYYKRSGGVVYKNHLITLKNPTSCHKNTLCLLNLGRFIVIFIVHYLLLETNNTWTTFDIKGINKFVRLSNVQTGDLMVYKHMILCLTTAGSDRNLVVAFLNMKSILIREFSFLKFLY